MLSSLGGKLIVVVSQSVGWSVDRSVGRSGRQAGSQAVNLKVFENLTTSILKHI